MKRRYAIVLILLGIFLMIGGVTYAYFTGKNLVQGEGASLSATTVTIEDVGLSVEGTLTFNDTDIWPGHQDISAIKVTAYGDNLVTYNLIWEGTSTISTAPLKYYVYKANTNENPKVTCTKKKSGSVNFRKYYEECTKEGFENLGEVVKTGEISNSTETTKITLMPNEAIKGTEDGTSVYYYVIVEFPNDGDSQNDDFGHTFEGKVTVEETQSDLADITITTIKKLEDGEYKEVGSQPLKEEGYTLDMKESSCDKGATLKWSDGSYSLKVNVKQTGTACTLAFKPKPTAKDTLADLGIDTTTAQEGEDSFTDIATSSDSGLFKGTDDYGTTYYYRGNVDNNWVKFGKTKNGDDIYWRIIRINGNGTIRLIYSGAGSAQTTGAGTQINGSTGVAFNTTYNDNKYVGYMYANPKDSGASTSYDTAHKNEANSTILDEIVHWYNGTKGKVDYSSTGFDASTYGSYLDGATGFCSDRRIRTDNTKWWSSEESNLSNLGWGSHVTAYAPFSRIVATNASITYKSTQTPVFTCGDKESKGRDLFTTSAEQGDGNGALPVPVGLITADEVIYAGGFGGKSNSSYYLYTNQYYWTMSPSYYYYLSSSNQYARVFCVYGNGCLDWRLVNSGLGVRPVINLKAGTTFTVNTEKPGTVGNPFTVAS